MAERDNMRDFTVPLRRVRRLVLATVFASASVVGWAATKGPDAGGYSGTDQTVYSFVDISGANAGAATLAGIDDGMAALTLPFSFQFYGQAYTMVCVSSNGALYFIANASACAFNDFANTDLSGTAPPHDLPAVLPFWNDLTFQAAGAGAVFYGTLGVPGSRRFVVQWDNAYPQGSADPVTFEAVLSEGSNRILFQYKTVGLGSGHPASQGGQSTIGIRNAGALSNDQQVAWSFEAPVIADNSALMFSPAMVNAAPECSAAAPSIATLWPPDHRMVTVSILGVTDPDTDPLTLRITSVWQDEPTNNEGLTATSIDGGGIGTSQAQVRAQRGTPRPPPSNGRVYRIAFTATDPAGAACSGEVQVSVPSKQGGTAIDDGRRYDSTVSAR